MLLHLDLPHRLPPLSAVRGPLQQDLLLDRTPAVDLTEPEPVPDCDFDQSVPDDVDG